MAKLTPEAVRSLKRAEEVSTEFGHTHVGCEHIVIGILRAQQSFPSQIMERDGSRERVLSELLSLISSEQYRRAGSNRVVDGEGRYLGRMVGGPDGKPRVVADDGTPISGPLEREPLPTLSLEMPD